MMSTILLDIEQALENQLFNQMKNHGGITRGGTLNLKELNGDGRANICIIKSATWIGPHQVAFMVRYTTRAIDALHNGRLELDMRDRARSAVLTILPQGFM